MVELFRCFGNQMLELLQSRHFVEDQDTRNHHFQYNLYAKQAASMHQHGESLINLSLGPKLGPKKSELAGWNELCKDLPLRCPMSNWPAQSGNQFLLARAPMGSHAGSVLTSCPKASMTSAGTMALSTTTSKTYSLNQSEVIMR